MILETIITTQDLNGNTHVTPFGVQKQDGFVVISPYKPSTTLANILATGVAVINLTDDVRVFAGALTKRVAWQLLSVNHVAGYRLANTLSHQELKLVKVIDDAMRPQLVMQVLHAENHHPFAGFNRAQAAVIELAVLVSRLNRLPMEKITQEMQYLQIAMDKTAGEAETQAWAWLVEAITNHQAKLNGENLA
jgi:uncharacterized protein